MMMMSVLLEARMSMMMMRADSCDAHCNMHRSVGVDGDDYEDDADDDVMIPKRSIVEEDVDGRLWRG